MQLTLGDGGIETDLIAHHGQTLPHFAAFVLLDDEAGREVLRAYYRPYLRLADTYDLPLVLETPTWRASGDWLQLLGRPRNDVRRVNQDAVHLVAELRDEVSHDRSVLLSGCVGPRVDGDPGPDAMTAHEAQRYHAPQMEALASAGADRVAAMTISYPAEATGIVRAGQRAHLPTVVSFTVETTGLLPDGTSLADAVHEVDDSTQGEADSFMVNCAHPRHIALALRDGGDWTRRISGVRANASTRSHAEMDAATVLDEGDPAEFARELLLVREQMPRAELLGGCCGTDVRHMTAVAEAHRRAVTPA